MSREIALTAAYILEIIGLGYPPDLLTSDLIAAEAGCDDLEGVNLGTKIGKENSGLPVNHYLGD